MPFATASDGTRLAYEICGDGDALLLVAGQGQDRHMWDYVLPDFVSRHRVIRFDHRGTGESDKPADPPYSTRGFADDAIAVLDEAGIDRAQVYGISMGGRVAQWLAAGHAERVGALVLGATTPGNAHGIARDAEADGWMRSQDLPRIMTMIASPEFLAAHPQAYAFRPIPLHALRLHYQASEAHDGWDLLPRIVAPTLVIHGSDDRMNPAANAPLLAARIPGAELAMLEGARHGYAEEFRHEASRIVLDFLRRHPL